MSTNVQKLQEMVSARLEEEGNNKFLTRLLIALELPFIADEEDIKQIFGNVIEFGKPKTRKKALDNTKKYVQEMARKRIAKRSTGKEAASTTSRRNKKRKEEEEEEEEDIEEEVPVESSTRKTRKTRKQPARRPTKRSRREEEEEEESDTSEHEGEEEEEEDRQPAKRARGRQTAQSKKAKSSSPSKSNVDSAIESSMTQLSSLLTMSQTQDLGGAFNQQISDEELKEVLSASYLQKTKNNAQLIERFKKVSDVLRKLGQPENIPEDLPWESDFPSVLINRKLTISRKDPDIQIYAANSIADVLRINAPESPYSDRELKTIFDFFLHQLRGLKSGSTDRLFAQRFYLLERLATIKIFVLALNLANPIDFVERLFETLFDIVSEKESYQQKAVSYLSDIMSSLLESCDVITTSMVELLLEQLLHRTDKRDEQVVGYALAHSVLEKTVDFTAQPIGDYINGEWESLTTQKGTGSNFKKHRARLFRMIYEMTLISTRLLLHVIPNIFSQLKVEDVTTRSSIIQLLGSMFSARESTLAKDYPTLFEEFLGRLEDAENKLRVYMCGFASKMLMNHHSTQQQINSRLEQRIMDSDEKVRRAVVEAVCEVATHFPHLTTKDLLKQIGERTRDKRAQLRMHTIQLLSDLYQHHTIGIHKGNDFWNEEFISKFAWIPGKLFSYYVEPQADADERLFVEKQVDEYLLHDELSTRTAALIDIWDRLTNFERTSFRRMLLVKRRFQHTVSSLLGYGETNHENTETNESTEAEGNNQGTARSLANLNLIISTLSNMLPDQLTGKRTWRQVYKKRSNPRNEMIRMLKDCVETDITFAQALKLKERAEALDKGETKETATYMTMVVQKCATNLITKDLVEAIFKRTAEGLGKGEESAKPTLLLLETISSIMPEHFVTSYAHIPKLIDSGDMFLLDQGLKILDATCNKMEDSDYDTTYQLHDRLFLLAHSGTVGQAKYATRCIAKMYIVNDDELSTLLSTLLAKLKFNDELPSVLASMRVIAHVGHEVYNLESDKVTDFCFDMIFTRASTSPSPRFSLPSIDCQGKVQAIKLLSASLLAKSKEGISEEFNSLSTRITSFLFRILMCEGDIKKAMNSMESVTTIDDDNDDDNEGKSEEEEFLIDFARYRLAAAKGVLELLSYTPETTAIISMDLAQFQNLCYVICDPVAEVRSSFIQKLKDMLLAFKLGLKYGAALLLGVADPDMKNAAIARQYATVVIQFFREQHKIKRTVQLSDYAAVQLYPEYILPYLIHLLAHHPNFDHEFNHSNMISFQKILFAFFDEACKEVDNMTFFHQMIYKLKQRKDRQDMESTRIQSLCDLAVSVLGRVTEGSGSVHSFPGKIFIPGMFVSTSQSDESTQQQHDRIDTIKTLFLPQDFHLDEKKARDFRSHLTAGPSSPKRKARLDQDADAPGSPKRATKKPSKKRKRRKKSETAVAAGSKKKTKKPRSGGDATEEEDLVPRRQPSRSARKKTKYEEKEEEDEEDVVEEEEEEEDEEDDVAEEDDIHEDSDDIDEEEEEEEIQSTRRRRKKKY